MLKAIKQIVHKFPFVHLNIMGDGPDRNILESYIEQNNLKNNIYLKGIQKDIPSLLVKSDLFLMTSFWEGFSIALLEAMATGLPVVTTNFPTMNEWIEDNPKQEDISSEEESIEEEE